MGALSVVAIVFGVFFVFGVVLTLLGRRLPVEHVATVRVILRSPVEKVFGLVDDVSSHPGWAPGSTAVERVADVRGHEAWRYRMGRNAFVLVTTAREPGRRIERTITDDHGPFSGSWSYEFASTDGGSTVTLTERGRIEPAMPRAILRYLVGESYYPKKHLRGLAKALGEEAVVVDAPA